MRKTLLSVRKHLAIALASVACLVVAAGASGALVRVGDLVLRADGGFTPRELPRREFAPIDFQGHADIKSTVGGVPPALRRVALDFDRDGRLTTAGLPTCAASAIESATPRQARQTCPRAIVGTGHVEALIAREGGPPLEVGSPLTLFNGPRQGGSPTAIFHAQIAAPAVQTFAVLVPIQRRSGAFAYRATTELPEIAGGRGALTHVDLKVGKRYRFRGGKRSYVSARCSDNVMETRGRFSFADGTVIDGAVMKPCTVR
jgi:hypothetical protein